MTYRETEQLILPRNEGTNSSRIGKSRIWCPSSALAPKETSHKPKKVMSSSSSIVFSTFCLNLDVEWRVTERWALFAEGRNLTGSTVYDWAYYYYDTAQGLLGVKFTF